MKTAILKLPSEVNADSVEELEAATKFDTSAFGSDVKTTEFHLNDVSKAASITENNIVLWDISAENAKSIFTIQLEGKNNPKFTMGKWNPHQNCNQVFINRNVLFSHIKFCFFKSLLLCNFIRKIIIS